MEKIQNTFQQNYIENGTYKKMKKYATIKLWKFPILLLGFVFIFFGFTIKIEASTLISGSGTNIQEMNYSGISGYDRAMQPLGTGFSNTGGFIIINMKGSTHAGGTSYSLCSWTSESAFSTTGGQNGCTVVAYATTTQYQISTGADYTITFPYYATLNPSLFYSFEFFGADNGTSVSSYVYGNTSIGITGLPVTNNALCDFGSNTCPMGYPLKQLSFEFTDTGGAGPGIDYSTHIETVTPADGTTLATSTSYTIGATGAIASNDFNENSKLKIHIVNSASTLSKHCFDVICGAPKDLLWAPGLSQNAITINLEYPLVIASPFSYSTTTTANLPIGKYWVTTEIDTGTFCFWGICLGDKMLMSTSTTFIIASTTKADKLVQSTLDYGKDLASSTAPLFLHCGITDLDLASCGKDLLYWAFIPTNDSLAEDGIQIHDIVLSHWPIGYITDFIEIISTSTIGTLTVIDATMPSALGIGTGQHIHLDITGALDQFLNATTSQFNNESASSTQTLFEITNHYWSILVWLGALLYILGRIIGQNIMPDLFGGRERSLGINKKGAYDSNSELQKQGLIKDKNGIIHKKYDN